MKLEARSAKVVKYEEQPQARAQAGGASYSVQADELYG